MTVDTILSLGKEKKCSHDYKENYKSGLKDQFIEFYSRLTLYKSSAMYTYVYLIPFTSLSILIKVFLFKISLKKKLAYGHA